VSKTREKRRVDPDPGIRYGELSTESLRDSRTVTTPQTE
jgi:hypothetical protein